MLPFAGKYMYLDELYNFTSRLDPLTWTNNDEGELFVIFNQDCRTLGRR